MRIHRRLSLFLIFAVTLCHAIPVDWTTPVAPFKIAGNLYYVGSRDLAAYLVVTPKGNILINANLESSPPQIRHSVEQLGFRWTDTKILLSSQAHYDHVAGAAEVLNQTHAKYMVMDGDVEVTDNGGATDFDPTLPHFPSARVDRTLHDNDIVALGGIFLAAHKTAGHTRGSTAWTMQTHEDGRTLNVVIVGGWGLNPGVALVPTHGKPAAYPGITADFDKTFVTLKSLPCDIFLGAHGGVFRHAGQTGSAPQRRPLRLDRPRWLSQSCGRARGHVSQRTCLAAVQEMDGTKPARLTTSGQGSHIESSTCQKDRGRWRKPKPN